MASNTLIKYKLVIDSSLTKKDIPEALHKTLIIIPNTSI